MPQPAQQQPAQQSQPRCSVREAFDDAVVLLTGATGFLGSLTLEALLHTRASRIYVLLRARGGSTPAERAAKLLQGAAFHRVRDDAAALARVVAVAGDLSQPGLGLAPADAAALQPEVTVIIHCAADIRLEPGITQLLRVNYLGTQALLQLAARCGRLAAFVHTSSAFANMHLPQGSVVGERLYPLAHGRRRVCDTELVEELLALPPAAADTRAAALRGRWCFPNAYTLSKHLTEQLVARHQQQGLPACIVRPSLVCAVLYEPLPGLFSNFAGPIGASAALALGFYHSLRCVSSKPLHVWDVVPADMVVNALLAAAAAVASGAASGIAAHALAATADGAAACDGIDGSGSGMLIVHSSSSSTFPLTLLEGWSAAREFIAAHRRHQRFSLSRGVPPAMPPSFVPNPAAVRWHQRWTAAKVAVACALLRLCGQAAAAARLRSGFAALCVYGASKTDKDLVLDSAALEALERALPADEASSRPLVMRPGMRLPAALGAAGSGEHAGQPLLQPGQRGQAEPVLTWRRYLCTQMASVFSLLFKSKPPRFAAPGGGAAPVEHDFVYVR